MNLRLYTYMLKLYETPSMRVLLTVVSSIFS